MAKRVDTKTDPQMHCLLANKALKSKYEKEKFPRSFINLHAVYRHDKNQQKQRHLGISEWKLRYMENMNFL